MEGCPHSAKAGEIIYRFLVGEVSELFYRGFEILPRLNVLASHEGVGVLIQLKLRTNLIKLNVFNLKFL